MFLILLGIATCDKLCYKPASVTGDSCPDGIAPTSTFATFSALTDAITSTGTIIYIAEDLGATDKFADAQIKLITEIKSYKSGDTLIAVKYELTNDATVPSLTTSKINLEVALATADSGKKLTCTSLVLEDGSTIKTGSVIAISKLVCTSITSGTEAIKLTTGEVTINGKDAIVKVEPDTTLKLTGGETSAVPLTVPNTVTKVTINSVMTIKAAALEISGALAGVTQTLVVNLTYGNEGETVIDLKSATGTTVPSSMKIYVNTYYKKGDQFQLIESCVIPNEEYALTNGKRKVPKAAEYCLDASFKRVSTCSADAQVLWKNEEVAGVDNGENLATVYVSGHDSSEVEVAAVADIKAKNIGFVGVANQQKIKIISADATLAITGEFLFNNIALNVEVPAAATKADVGFKKLTVLKSSIAAVKAAGSGSKSLRVDPTVAVVAEDLISDADSFTNFKVEKPSKSLTLVGVTAATFEGDGSKVTVGSLQLPKEKIPEKFAISVLSGTETQTTSLEITENTGGANKPVPFSLDVPAGSELTLNYEGDWTGVEVIVNVPKGGKFIGKSDGDANKPPTMKAQGEGTATLNGENIEKIAPPVEATPTPKGGLSGGAIAGIVIACVVVVAAVVVVVVVVIKKKKGKVAN